MYKNTEKTMNHEAYQLQSVQPQSSVPATFNFFDKEQFNTMQRVSTMFAKSELVPDMYKESDKNPLDKAIANCMIAISMAMRIQADPLMIMQNMIIIYGRPSWSSKFLISTVNTCGRFNPLKFKFNEKGMLGKVPYTEYVWNGKTKAPVAKEFDGTKMMDVECVAYTTERGSNEVLESAPISLRLAIQEGWYTKNGSKWQTMPRQMLMYRAASFWTNIYAPELSMGMKTVDEVQDIEDVDYEEINHEDVVEKVNKEKSSQANKTEIGMDAPSEQADDSTREDKEGKSASAPSGKAAPIGNDGHLPGF